MINDNNEIGKTIKFYRELKHLSQAKLAEQIGVSQRNVSYYESGDHIPPADVLKKLANIFNISIDQLVGTKKIGADNNCENYFYEEGLANWNIKKKAKDQGLSYEEVLDRTCIEEERFNLLWYGNVQPIAEELIRFSEVLNVSVDFLLDNSQQERITAEEEIILLYYKQFPDEVMDLLNSFCSLKKKDRTKVLGKCFELEDENPSVAADEMPSKKTGTTNTVK